MTTKTITETITLETLVRGIAEAARELAANVDEEDYKPGFYKRGNLGHCHDNPPQWDSKRQGTCERCALWMQLLSRLAAWDARNALEVAK